MRSSSSPAIRAGASAGGCPILDQSIGRVSMLQVTSIDFPNRVRRPPGKRPDQPPCVGAKRYSESVPSSDGTLSRHTSLARIVTSGKGVSVQTIALARS